MSDEGKVSEAAAQVSETVVSDTADTRDTASAASTASIDPGRSVPVEKSAGDKKKEAAKSRPKKSNQLRKLREERCLSQAELARRANLSALTIARIEKGFGCRMSTKRKILEALGLSLADRIRVFGEEE